MEVAPARPWRIREERWNEEYDVPLWFRAAERIDVPAGGVVPGPAEIDPAPDRSADPADASELAAGWLAWWEALTGQLPLREPLDPSRLPSAMVFTGPPDFDGMADWPALRRVLAGRWHEATDWYRQRKIAGLAAGHQNHLPAIHAVRALERELGRRVKPFDMDFVLLPVRDDQIRPLRPGRYLVPQRLRDGPRWPQLLRELLLPHA